MILTELNFLFFYKDFATEILGKVQGMEYTVGRNIICEVTMSVTN